MRILFINKFLHQNGGSETYMFKLGEYLHLRGHEVEYFGMEHEGRIVGNRVGAYTSDMDFHGGSKLAKLTYPVKTIYSREARRKLRQVLDDFRPDVCHLNNFNYQLTPSVILEIRKWERETRGRCKVVYTAHDYQLVCPNHMCHDPSSHKNCERCLDGSFLNCTKGRCIHGSFAKSLVGSAEAIFWKWMRVYRELDAVICCSHFMKSRIDTNPVLREKSVVMHNFIDVPETEDAVCGDYVLYFGRYSQEKGIRTLIRAARELKDVKFVFAGTGPLENELSGAENITNVGFVTGDRLSSLIREAAFTVYPSEWYENCPLSVMESQSCGTPIIAADIGGIPELVEAGRTGELFESGNVQQLKEKIASLYSDRQRRDEYASRCRQMHFPSAEEYCEKLMHIYRG